MSFWSLKKIFENTWLYFNMLQLFVTIQSEDRSYIL
jgi:hypothetical protein